MPGLTVLLRWLLLPLFHSLLLGVLGAISGFTFGMFLDPGKGEGAGLVFILTGPLGLGLGLACGLAAAADHPSRRRPRIFLGVSTAVVLLAATIFNLPHERHIGHLVEGDVVECVKPSVLAPAKIESWEETLRWSSALPKRAGDWKAGVMWRSKKDGGVVLRVRTREMHRLDRKGGMPGFGSLKASRQHPESPEELFYATYAGASCAGYPHETKRFLARVEKWGTRTYPPMTMQGFLSLQTVDPLPARYERFFGR